MTRWSISLIVLTGAVLALSACGANPDIAPPGYAAHQPNNAANAPADRRSGACRLFTIDQIHTAFGGTVAGPIADNLTPGLDRCNWLIHQSNLGGDITLVIYRPNPATRTPPAVQPKSKRHPSEQSVPVPSLGQPAYWIPTTDTLTYTRQAKPLGLQLILSRNAKITSDKALAALTTLARSGT